MRGELQVIPIVYNKGVFYSICSIGAWTPRLETYYIINYLFKCACATGAVSSSQLTRGRCRLGAVRHGVPRRQEEAAAVPPDRKSVV